MRFCPFSNLVQSVILYQYTGLVIVLATDFVCQVCKLSNKFLIFKLHLVHVNSGAMNKLLKVILQYKDSTSTF